MTVCVLIVCVLGLSVCGDHLHHGPCLFGDHVVEEKTCQNVLECELEIISAVLCLYSLSINVDCVYDLSN